VVRFDLLLLSAESELYRYILSPKLTSESFIPTTTAPTVVTNAVSSVTATSATLNGGITADGGAAVTARGFAYGTSPNPTAADNTVQAGSGTGDFCYTLSGLAPSTTYHVRAFAVNITGTSYGEDRTFSTQSDGDNGNSSGGTGNENDNNNETAEPEGNDNNDTGDTTGNTDDGAGNTGGSNGETGTPLYTADVLEDGVKTDTLPVLVDSTRTGTAGLDASKAAVLFSAGNTSVSMPDIPGINAYKLELPAAALADEQNSGVLTLNTGFGSVTFSERMLSSMLVTAGTAASVSITRCDTSGLTDEEKAAVGIRPVIQLTLTLDGEQTDWNNPAAPVTVTIPYKPTAEELKNPESLIIWYLDGRGKPVCIPNGHYDADTGTVTFTVAHFSRYGVGYNPVSFKDVAADTKDYSPVAFIAARGITTGTGGGNYSPVAIMTRGEFIVLLMRAYSITPDTNPTDNFVDAGNTWYTSYLAAAKRLGLTRGVGGNRFAPEQKITRQEMFALLFNSLKATSQLPEGTSGKSPDGFSDTESVDVWAKDAISYLVRKGIITDNEDKLNPTGVMTRAETAQVLYKLLLKSMF
jgi:hypothetical protein